MEGHAVVLVRCECGAESGSALAHGEHLMSVVREAVGMVPLAEFNKGKGEGS